MSDASFAMGRFRNAAHEWSSLEDQRRMAWTALAVKLFKMQKGVWPKNLADLSEVELSAFETRTVTGESLGYEVDGDSAYIWRYQILEPDTLFSEKREYRIASSLRSMRAALEEISSSELVRVR